MRITLPSGTAAALAVPEEASMGLVIAPDLWGELEPRMAAVSTLDDDAWPPVIPSG